MINRHMILVVTVILKMDSFFKTLKRQHVVPLSVIRPVRGGVGIRPAMKAD